MKATAADVVEVVADIGGVVERAEIEYQLNNQGKTMENGLLDNMVKEGELEPIGEYEFKLPEAFGGPQPTVKTRDRTKDLDSDEMPEAEKKRECKRCGEDFTPTTPTGRICTNCDKRRQQPGPPPEPEPEPEPEEPVEEFDLFSSPLTGIFGDRGVPARVDRRSRKGMGWTDEEIIARIQLYNELTGAPPTKLDLHPAKLLKAANKARSLVSKHLDRLAFYREGDWPSETTIREHFGSFSAALVAAGFEPRATGRQPVGEVPPPREDDGTLERLWDRLERIRKDGKPGDIRGALYDLGMAALTEADRMGK